MAALNPDLLSDGCRVAMAVYLQHAGAFAKVANARSSAPAPDKGSPQQASDAQNLVALALEDEHWLPREKQNLAEMLKEWLPKVVEPWGKDERKKLKLSALKPAQT